MHECITHLLKSTSEERSLEGFAKLMTTIGKDLDTEDTKVGVHGCGCMHMYKSLPFTCIFLLQQRIETYFSIVNNIIKKGKISPRVRFALQDVVDLRENKWVPRQRQDSQVKTIDQIHREAHDEEQLTKQIASQYVGGGGGGGEEGDGGFGLRDGRPSAMEDKMRGPKPGQDGGEEWSKVEKRPQQSRPDLECITVMKRGREEISSGLIAVTKKEEGMVLSKEVEGILQINTCKWRCHGTIGVPLVSSFVLPSI